VSLPDVVEHDEPERPGKDEWGEAAADALVPKRRGDGGSVVHKAPTPVATEGSNSATMLTRVFDPSLSQCDDSYPPCRHQRVRCGSASESLMGS
jgi:hypothetical protein